MKKIILSMVALVLFAGLASAQDLAQATETYNNGAAALASGDKVSALQSFRSALEAATACGEEGAEVVENCKNVIPTIALSIAKDAIKGGEFDTAIAKLEEASKIAEEFGATDTIEEAKTLIPQVLKQKAGNLLNVKNYAGAAEAYKKVLEIDPADGTTALRLGMALAGSGDKEGAIEAYKSAAANGQEANANKQLSGLFLKESAAALKTKNYAAAVESAVKSTEFGGSSQAYLIAGQASQQLKKNADAIKYFEKYVELEPNAKNAPSINFTIGALYQQAGNKEKAKAFYQKVANDPTLGAQAKQLLGSL